MIYSSKPNNLYFRLASHNGTTGFGTRLLRAHIHNEDGQHTLIASTQTYQSPDGRLLGEKDIDVSDDVPETDTNALKRWHFVYMGFDSTQKKVFVYVWLHNGAQHLPLNNIYHYLTRNFFLYIAKDGVDSPFLGRIAHVRINAGPGAF